MERTTDDEWLIVSFLFRFGGGRKKKRRMYSYVEDWITKKENKQTLPLYDMFGSPLLHALYTTNAASAMRLPKFNPPSPPLFVYLLLVPALLLDLVQHLLGRARDARPRAEDGTGPRLRLTEGIGDDVRQAKSDDQNPV